MPLLFSWIKAFFRGKHPDPQRLVSPPSNDAAHQHDVAHDVDNGVRMHIASQDPAFPAKREAAFDLIHQAVDRVAQAHGFTPKAKSWTRDGPLGTATLHLQRSRYGFDCRLNLGFRPVSNDPLGLWVDEDVLPLDRFYDRDSGQPARAAGFVYLDVLDDPDCLKQPMQVLDQRALPWLLAHLTDHEAHGQPM